MPTRLATKGDMTSRGVLSVVFKIPKCTSHLGIGLVTLRAAALVFKPIRIKIIARRAMAYCVSPGELPAA